MLSRSRCFRRNSACHVEGPSRAGSAERRRDPGSDGFPGIQGPPLYGWHSFDPKLSYTVPEHWAR